MRLLALASLCLLSACSGATTGIGLPREEAFPEERPVGRTAEGPGEVPQGTFTGVRDGCENLLAYRGSADATQFAVIQIDREKLGLEVGATPLAVDLGTTPEGVGVFVDVFSAALQGEKPYCSDRSEGELAMTRWTAQAGKLTIALAKDPESTDTVHPTYRATLRLEKVHFVGPEGGFAVVVPSIVIEDVRVGWLPG